LPSTPDLRDAVGKSHFRRDRVRGFMILRNVVAAAILIPASGTVGENGDAHAGRHHAANRFDGQRTESDIGQESRSNSIFTDAMTIHRQKNSKKDERGRSCENRLSRFHCHQEQSH